MSIDGECATCGSGQEREFTGEIAIHFPGLKGLENPIVWVFPKVFVCPNCGLAKFQIPQEELRVLGETDPAGEGLTACPLPFAYQARQRQS